MRTAQKGFTLAELLIALALLGLIAAFTIPKVLQASSNNSNIAKVKETVSTLEQAWESQKLQNTYTSGTSLYSSLLPNLNVVSSGTGTPTGGCSAYTGYVKFSSGVVVAGLIKDAAGTAGDNIPAGLAGTGTNEYEICIDSDPTATTHTAGTNLFFGNFSPTGSITSTAASNKDFAWGDPNSTWEVYKAGISSDTTTSNGGAGVLLTQ